MLYVNVIAISLFLLLFREETCQRVAEENNYEILPSSDHYDIIAGQVNQFRIFLISKTFFKTIYL